MDSALVLLLVGILYMLPALNAAMRRHHNAGAITLLTLLLGWTLLGWVVALVWSATAVRELAPQPEIERPAAREVVFSLWWLAAGVGVPLLGMLMIWLSGKPL